MFSGSAKFKNNFKGGTAFVLEHLARTVAATGEDIAEQTRENMHPGFFLDTGLSQDETRWEQLDKLSGQIHIPTAYAAYPELGTARMAPRPVLIPAIMMHFPSKLHEHWAEGDLPELKPFGSVEPMIRADRRTGQGYA